MKATALCVTLVAFGCTTPQSAPCPPCASCANFPISVNACVPLPSVDRSEELVKAVIKAGRSIPGYRIPDDVEGYCVAWSNNLDLPASSGDSAIFAFSSCKVGDDLWLHTPDGQRRALLLLQCVRRPPQPDISNVTVDAVIHGGPRSSQGFVAEFDVTTSPFTVLSMKTTWME